MRSKEVEDAIKDLMPIEITDIYDNKISVGNKSIETVLSYIEELENKLECIKNITPSGYINGKYLEETAKRYINKDKIRDKIKELENKIKIEHNEKVIVWLHKQKIILKSLLRE